MTPRIMAHRVRICLWAADLLSLTRIHASGWFVCLIVIGYSNAAAYDIRVLLALIVFGIATSCLGFVANNLADIDRDSLDQRRHQAPLVAGRMTERGALLAATTCLLIAGVGLLGMPVDTKVKLLGVVVIVLMVIGNVYQKSLGRFALAGDLVFGVGMGLAMVLGLTAADWRGDMSLNWLAVGAVAAQMILLNVTAGNLKDLRIDLIAPRTTTTALVLGVLPRSSGIGYHLSPKYLALIRSMHWSWIVVSLVMIVFQFTSSDRTLFLFLAASIAAALILAATWALETFVRTNRNAKGLGREWFLFANFTALLLLTPHSNLQLAAIAITVVAVVSWERAISWLVSALYRNARHVTRSPDQGATN